MKTWKFTSYHDGGEITLSGLSQFQAVTALEKAIAGEDPFPQEKPQAARHEQRETVATEQLIAA